MRSRNTRSSDLQPSLSFVLAAALLLMLWLTGGASRGDVMGQVLVRVAAWVSLIGAIIFARRPSLTDLRPVAVLLVVVVALPLLQLMPLPPSLWQALPGRELIVHGDALIPGTSPWRPLSLSPDDTVNAASSLVVAVTMLVLLAGLKTTERAWLAPALLVLAAGSMLVGLLQFSGGRFNQPLINYNGDISGTFANRNHFALFLALGCLAVPLWALSGHRRHLQWRLPIAAGLLLLFLLTALASGSRAGMVLTVAALPLGALIVREDAVHRMRDRPRWILPALLASGVAVITVAVVLAVALDRAVSIQRLLTADVGQDMRVRGSRTVLAMVRAYFPVGTGLGSFDPLFRIQEPFALLKLTYFNHAHDDFFEIVLDTGVGGVLLLLAALLWWLVASQRVWFGRAVTAVVLGRLGSAMIALVLLASIVDYPARTPLVMAMVTIAAALLAWGAAAARTKATHDKKPVIRARDLHV